jgi:hypothetical protein
VTPSRTAAPGRLLAQVAGERKTGTLVVGGHPGGMVHLLEGAVVYAESPAAPGVGELLTASGRLAGRTWQAALDAGTAGAEVGQLLLDQGHLTRGELELCVLGAIYDAAYFVLSQPTAPVEFRSGAAHWLGPVIRVDPAAVNREARRRARLLEEIHPHPRFDTAPVSPVPRPPVERVALTAAQWELLVHADGQRTPADLAQLLGRAGFATILQLRKLAAQGLIELPDVRDDNSGLVRLPRARGIAVDLRRPVVTLDSGPRVPVAAPPLAAPADKPLASPADPPLASSTGPPPAPSTDPPRVGEPSTGDGVGYRPPPRLARRKPGAKLPKGLPPEPPPEHTGTDEVLLKRIRTALRALR